MKPRHFWWLVADHEEEQGAQIRLSDNDRKDILEALKGNGKGDFW